MEERENPEGQDVEGHAYDADNLDRKAHDAGDLSLGAASPPDEDVEGHAFDAGDLERGAHDAGDLERGAHDAGDL